MLNLNDMDKEILMNILNRVEGKVDNLSTGLATNTSVTESHTRMLADMKGVHDLNAKVILDTRDEVKDLTSSLKRIESWKDGQTLYQHQTMEDIKNLHDRFRPIEEDFIQRGKKKAETGKTLSDIAWRAFERVVLIIIGAILISWREIINNIK